MLGAHSLLADRKVDIDNLFAPVSIVQLLFNLDDRDLFRHQAHTLLDRARPVLLAFLRIEAFHYQLYGFVLVLLSLCILEPLGLGLES